MTYWNDTNNSLQSHRGFSPRNAQLLWGSSFDKSTEQYELPNRFFFSLTISNGAIPTPSSWKDTHLLRHQTQWIDLKFQLTDMIYLGGRLFRCFKTMQGKTKCNVYDVNLSIQNAGYTATPPFTILFYGRDRYGTCTRKRDIWKRFF